MHPGMDTTFSHQGEMAIYWTEGNGTIVSVTREDKITLIMYINSQKARIVRWRNLFSMDVLGIYSRANQNRQEGEQ